jgi:hypothetical protein
MRPPLIQGVAAQVERGAFLNARSPYPVYPICPWRRSTCAGTGGLPVFLQAGTGRVAYFPWDIDRILGRPGCDLRLMGNAVPGAKNRRLPSPAPASLSRHRLRRRPVPCPRPPRTR